MLNMIWVSYHHPGFVIPRGILWQLGVAIGFWLGLVNLQNPMVGPMVILSFSCLPANSFAECCI